MKPHEMSVDRAIQDLEEHGSSQDPIFYKGQETTPEQLSWKVDDGRCDLRGYTLAGEVRIGYYGGKDLHLIKRGTLSGMVKDRRRLREDRDRAASFRATVDMNDEADDPHFTLADWRRMINRLIRKYGKDTVMYTDGGYNNVTLRLEKP